MIPEYLYQWLRPYLLRTAAIGWVDCRQLRTSSHMRSVYLLDIIVSWFEGAGPLLAAYLHHYECVIR